MLAAPQLRKDINTGTAESWPSGFVEMGGIAFFTADDGIHGDELWKLEAPSGTPILVADVNPDGSGCLGRKRHGSAGTQPTG